MGKFINLTGDRFGRLTVRHRDNSGRKDAKWVCECDCGKLKSAMAYNLKSGATLSCGCLRKEATSARCKTHGQSPATGKSASPEWNSWNSMKQRCSNPKRKSYSDYGGRGITVCQRWASFENFLADMGTRPDGYTLDRIDNEKGYEPGNCRWASRRDQRLNQRPRRKKRDDKAEGISEECS